MGALADVLQQLFDLLGRVSAADLLNDGLAFQPVAQRWPDEERSEVNSNDVGQRAEFLGRDLEISPNMPRPDGQRRD